MLVTISTLTLDHLPFLLAKQWELHALSPDQETWAFVEPRLKHAIANVGDSLRFPSDGQLLSAVHRVIPIHENQNEDRYSIAYFLRIADDCFRGKHFSRIVVSEKFKLHLLISLRKPPIIS